MNASPQIEERARGGWGWLWRRLGGRSEAALAGPVERCVATAELLLAESSDGQAVHIATALSDMLAALSADEMALFLQRLASAFGPDHARLQAAVNDYLNQPDGASAAWIGAAAQMRAVELLRRLNMTPGATALIVALRAEMLRLGRSEAAVALLAEETRQLLSSWFNRGFLRAEKLDWQSPAAVLESIIRFESVHAIDDWDSLRRRLDGNRRCFAFFHPAMPGVPLIFIEVALTDGMSDRVGPILDGDDRNVPLDAPTHAMFYSINNCHRGLAGISLGDLLIKQVVLDLRTEFPSLKSFATLSPIPGFRTWLTEECRIGRVSDLPEALLDAPDLLHDGGAAGPLRDPLTLLCARYLSGRTANGGSATVSDPVGRFHLSNGARLERINWCADPSPKGVRESFGLMVNYRYVLDTIDANHRAFVGDGRVAISSGVAALLDPPSVSRRIARTSAWIKTAPRPTSRTTTPPASSRHCP
ncbi:malonyl-CoA decarboxylase domain-containing protein [uncultured Sphingomonas sp.]|uniref:malonyl-CoA decarboxylase domain-containing protein n=1 Tax=uncultured Sphingomonas sp. TaxID=158754 RepID=UPI0035CC8452